MHEHHTMRLLGRFIERAGEFERSTRVPSLLYVEKPSTCNLLPRGIEFQCFIVLEY